MRPDVAQGQCQSVAILHNGFTIEHTRHEVVGSSTRLWMCGGADAGYVEIPSEQIENFEHRPSAVPSSLPTAVRATAANAEGKPPGENSLEMLIARTASQHAIDPDFVTSVMKAESGFNPAAVSPKGAGGLMQLMPQTAAALGVKDVLDAAANVEGGTKYLRQLLDQYGGDAVKALAAYNAGPRRVKQYGGVPPYRETQAFIARIIGDYNRKKLEQLAIQANEPALK
jgi:soluble lytic murein transglycosylase-like protein